MNPLQSLRHWVFGRRTTWSAIAPETGFYAIGDIHGCDGLLAQALQKVPGDLPIVCLGDYVDRGASSAQVLHRLMRRTDIHCLGGNHEEMLLNFLDSPLDFGVRWLRLGGSATLTSFGIPTVSKDVETVDLKATAQALRHAMGSEMIAWLRQRPLMFRSGNVVAVHAGMDPARSVEDQLRRDLIWGHPAFLKSPRTDGIWVVHGHFITEAPTARTGRVAIDTGAYSTGRLTVARITPGSVEFL